MKKVVYTGPVSANTGGTPGASPITGGSGGQTQFLLNLVQTIFTRSDATLQSSSTSIDGHAVYDIHVVPQGQTSATGGAGSFDYTGEVYIDKVTQLPIKVNLNIQGLANAVLDLPSLALNTSIPESTFTFDVPPGVKVLPLAQASVVPGTGSLTLVQA